jgi:hypothetical protein
MQSLLDEKTQLEKENSSDIKVEETDEYFLSTEKDDLKDETEASLSINDALIDCVKHHQIILDFTKLLEDFFRWLMFPKLFYTGEDYQLARNTSWDN